MLTCELRDFEDGVRVNSKLASPLGSGIGARTPPWLRSLLNAIDDDFSDDEGEKDGASRQQGGASDASKAQSTTRTSASSLALVPWTFSPPPSGFASRFNAEERPLRLIRPLCRCGTDTIVAPHNANQSDMAPSTVDVRIQAPDVGMTITLVDIDSGKGKGNKKDSNKNKKGVSIDLQIVEAAGTVDYDGKKIVRVWWGHRARPLAWQSQRSGAFVELIGRDGVPLQEVATRYDKDFSNGFMTASFIVGVVNIFTPILNFENDLEVKDDDAAVVGEDATPAKKPRGPDPRNSTHKATKSSSSGIRVLGSTPQALVYSKAYHKEHSRMMKRIAIAAKRK